MPEFSRLHPRRGAGPPHGAATPARSLEEIRDDDTRPRGCEGSYPIDLPTALRLAAGRNLELAGPSNGPASPPHDPTQAQLSIVPDLQAGAAFWAKNGLLQDIAGAPIQTQRVDRSAGLGASTGLPGVAVDLGLSDAIFNPLARSRTRKRPWPVSSAPRAPGSGRNRDRLLRLCPAHGDLLLAREIEAASRKLADDTTAFARAGEGLEADSASGHRHLSAAEGGPLCRRGRADRAILGPRPSPAPSRLPRTHSGGFERGGDAPRRCLGAGRTPRRHRPAAPTGGGSDPVGSLGRHGTAAPAADGTVPAPCRRGYSSYDYAAGRGVGSDEKDTRDEVSA